MSLIVQGDPPNPNEVDDRQLLEDLDGLHLLTGEAAFVLSVSEWFDEQGFITEKQREALEEIYARAEAR